MSPRSTWILTEGLAGTEAPCRGLARALGLEPTIKRVKVRQPWDSLPGRFWVCTLDAPTADSDPLAPPWPDLLISSGNVAAPLAVAIKRASGGTTRIVHIQNPKMKLALFDLVIAPRHDAIDGANVVVTRGTLHALAPGALEAAAREWEPAFARLKRPLVAFLCSDAAADITGQTFVAGGDTVAWMQGWTRASRVKKDKDRWTPAELVAAKAELFGDKSTRPPRFG